MHKLWFMYMHIYVLHNLGICIISRLHNQSGDCAVHLRNLKIARAQFVNVQINRVRAIELTNGRVLRAL